MTTPRTQVRAPWGLEGRVGVVTGGGSGIGRASALAFAREGALVIIADIDAEDGEETRRLIEAVGGQAIFAQTDVSQATEVEALIHHILEAHGRLDFAHNNAGILPPSGRTHELQEADWDRTIAVNLKGVWLCMKYELPQMVTQGGGAIVNTASVSGLEGNAGLGVYTASKHGVIGLTKAAAQEYIRDGIRINAVCPGFVLTPMMARYFDRAVEQGTSTREEFEEQFTAGLPVGRLGRPEEVANTVVWLCSEQASFVTGAAMPIDGGGVAGVILPTAWGRVAAQAP